MTKNLRKQQIIQALLESEGHVPRWTPTPSHAHALYKHMFVAQSCAYDVYAPKSWVIDHHTVGPINRWLLLDSKGLVIWNGLFLEPSQRREVILSAQRVVDEYRTQKTADTGESSPF